MDSRCRGCQGATDGTLTHQNHGVAGHDKRMMSLCWLYKFHVRSSGLCLAAGRSADTNTAAAAVADV